MKFCKPRRMAWSVGWGLIGVLLCMLWVRSYWWQDNVRLVVFVSGWSAESAVGQFALRTYPASAMPATQEHVLEWFPVSTDVDPCHPAGNRIGFKVDSLNVYDLLEGYAGVVVPHWLLLLLVCAMSGLGWLRGETGYRFSLRTLFVATTLIAVVLGIIVWLR